MNEALRPSPVPDLSRRPPAGGVRVFRDGLLFMAAVGTAILVWQLSQLLLVVFACALVAMMVAGFATSLRRRLHLPFGLAFTLAVVLPLAFVVSAFSLFGATMAAQFQLLLESLPAALRAAQDMLMASEAGRRVLAEVPGLMPSGARVIEVAQSVLSDLGTVVSMVAIILVGGIYFAAQPRLYTRSLLALLPPERRLPARRAWKRIVGSLHAWLKAQGVGMAFVGIATGAGLSVVGIPGAPAIGLVAGLCEFVPYLGTFVVAIPAILIGFSISLETGIWTILVIIAVQQIQGNLVSPMAQSRLADLPPALTIFALIAFGVLMGPLGVILAVPLTVVGVALLKELVIAGRKRGVAPLAD
ncbi:AI-2E family transporter [Thermaurantiacus sp.]